MSRLVADTTSGDESNQLTTFVETLAVICAALLDVASTASGEGALDYLDASRDAWVDELLDFVPPGDDDRRHSG